jgi:peptidoglycan biosynthesis protein MviN/MurJ (putative lipid II flippase)
MGGILIVMSGILGIFIVNVVFTLLGILPWETDIQMLLLYVIFPLSILVILISLAMAILLTRKKE